MTANIKTVQGILNIYGNLKITIFYVGCHFQKSCGIQINYTIKLLNTLTNFMLILFELSLHKRQGKRQAHVKIPGKPIF